MGILLFDVFYCGYFILFYLFIFRVIVFVCGILRAALKHPVGTREQDINIINK